jgi:SAM-dependent methyltransferase
MLDPHYVNPKLVELYDLTCGWSADRDFYLSLAHPSRQRILDLGCGTGLLCDAYAARNHDVTGVDPAASMLDVARRKPHGKDVEWVRSSAQTYRSEKRFDIIIMTGHAFSGLAGRRRCSRGLHDDAPALESGRIHRIRIPEPGHRLEE